MVAKAPTTEAIPERITSTTWKMDLVPGTDSVVSVDLNVTSTARMEDAVAKLQKSLNARRVDRDLELLGKQLNHIDSELEKTADEGVLLSLEHLELYQQYLDRIVTIDLSEAITDKVAELLAKVSKQHEAHPLASAERSGDRVMCPGDNVTSTYFKVPMGRRRQMAFMIYSNFLTGPALTNLLFFLIWWYVPYMTYLYLLYFAWQTYDNSTVRLPDRMRVSQALRHSHIYELFRDYFPIRLVRAADAFDPTANYMFCYHPHGVQSAGAFSFTNAATGFDKMFPGLTCSVQTLSMNFKLPFIRENILALGAGDASKACILRGLKAAPGSSVMLVTGGAKESLYAHPYLSRVVLKERAGFVKVAINAGASLVPCWGFGENNLYENLAANSATLRRWQRRVQKMISFAPLLVAGRGVFTYSGGLIPRRRPITVVVGEPIAAGPADANPSNEKIEELHQKYIKAVEQIFNTYKDIYDPKAEPLQLL